MFYSNCVLSQFNLIGLKLNSGNKFKRINENNYPPNSSYLSSSSRSDFNSYSSTLFTEKIKDKKIFFRFNLCVEYSNSIQLNQWIFDKEIENRILTNKKIQFIPSAEIGKIIELDNLNFRFGVGLSINYNQNLRSSSSENSSITNQSYQIYKEQYQNYKPNQFGCGLYFLTGIYYNTKYKFSFGLEFTNGLNFQYTHTNNIVYVDKINKTTNAVSSYTTTNNSKNTQFNTNLMKPSLVVIYKLN